MEKNFTISDEYENYSLGPDLSTSNRGHLPAHIGFEAFSARVSHPKLAEFNHHLNNLVWKFSAIVEYSQSVDQKVQHVYAPPDIQNCKPLFYLCSSFKFAWNLL